MSKSTLNAMLSRGIDSAIAENLIEKNITIKKLKLKNIDELLELNIPEEIAKKISKEQRPPIPSSIITKLLCESKWTCCVCRDNNTRPIVIHHINEWSETKNHSENNLVVLCVEHHDLAHTKKELSTNLTPKRLEEIKKSWIQYVKQNDTNLIGGLYNNDNFRWDYFNHNRIFEIFLEKNLSNSNFRTAETINNFGLINTLGTFSINNEDISYMYNFDNGFLLSVYMKELFDEVLSTISLINLTNNFTRTYIESHIKPGVYIALEKIFYFKKLNTENKNRNQTRECYCKKDKIKITFEFDAYESTSCSSWSLHLSGQQKQARVIGLVKTIITKKDILTITLSCLAIG